MARVTSINARPPEEPLPNGGGFLSVDPALDSRIADIFAMDNGKLVTAIGLALTTGMGVMFSPTQDGGALGVHVYDGEKRDKRYVTSRNQFEALMEALRDYAEAKLIGQASELRKVAPDRSSRK
jgi:hypothetical protein